MENNTKYVYEIILASEDFYYRPFEGNYMVPADGIEDTDKKRVAETVANYLKEQNAPIGKYHLTVIISTSDTEEYVDSEHQDVVFDGETVWFDFENKYVAIIEISATQFFGSRYRSRFRCDVCKNPKKAKKIAINAIQSHLKENECPVGRYCVNINVLKVATLRCVDGLLADCFFDGDAISFKEDGEKICFTYSIHHDSVLTRFHTWYDSIKKGKRDAASAVAHLLKEKELPAGEYKITRMMEYVFSDSYLEDPDDDGGVFIAAFDGETVQLTAMQEDEGGFFL